MKKIEFYRHNLTSADKKECLKVLNSLFLTTGKKTLEFEIKFSAYLQVNYTVGVSSCTDALFLSLKALNIKPGDEVITTPLSYIATANVIEYCGAKPVFIDVNPYTGNINADLIQDAITDKTKAILAVHLYGQMCDMKKIASIAKKYKLKVIEDCAHCIEGQRDGVRPGDLSDLACFSFYATKNITSGEGGAITTNNKDLYEWLQKARLHGMSKNALDRYNKKYEHYDMEFLGYKCNMTDLEAALLINQLKRIEKYRQIKENISQKYDRGFYSNNAIQIPKVLPNTKHARHLYTIWVDADKRDNYLRTLQEKGIGVAVNFKVIHLMSYYKNKYKYVLGSFPIAEKIGNSTITLPLYPKLKESEVNYIVDTVNRVIH
jgi:dTDP-4-amino-4,6-dideoxygalactose transaminase